MYDPRTSEACEIAQSTGIDRVYGFGGDVIGSVGVFTRWMEFFGKSSDGEICGLMLKDFGQSIYDRWNPGHAPKISMDNEMMDGGGAPNSGVEANEIRFRVGRKACQSPEADPAAHS